MFSKLAFVAASKTLKTLNKKVCVCFCVCGCCTNVHFLSFLAVSKEVVIQDKKKQNFCESPKLSYFF